MRALILVLVMGLAVSSLGSLASASPVVATAPEADEASLRAVNAREVADFMSADAQGLEGLWADSFVVTNPLNQFVTKSQVVGLVSSGIIRFPSYDRKMGYVRTYGCIAIVAGAEMLAWSG